MKKKYLVQINAKISNLAKIMIYIFFWYGWFFGMVGCLCEDNICFGDTKSN